MTIEATLAELAVEIRHMRDDITEMKAQTQRDQDKADQSRTKVHARLDEVVKSVTVLEEQRKTDSDRLNTIAAATETRLESVETVTDEVKRWKIMGMTSISIVGIGAAALGITFADFFKRMLQMMMGRM